MIKWLKTTALDFCVRWVLPLLSFLILVSGALLSFDFTALRTAHPGWSGLFDVLESPLIIKAFFVSGFLTLLITWANSFRQKSISRLKSELASAQSQIDQVANNIEILFDGLLLNLSKRLGFAQDAQARISIYIHQNSKGKFIPCGRYSPNPELRKRGRTSYPDDQGCIAQGWRNGWHYDDQFPEDWDDHRSYCKDSYDVPNGVHRNFKMQSRVYAVKRVDDRSANPLAVIVVETTDPNQFNANQLQADLESVVEDFAQMIGTLREHIPNPADAASRGL